MKAIYHFFSFNRFVPDAFNVRLIGLTRTSLPGARGRRLRLTGLAGCSQCGRRCCRRRGCCPRGPQRLGVAAEAG